MLVASGKLSIGQGAMRSTFFLGRELHVHVVERTGLVFDSRVAPELSAPSPSFVVSLAPIGGLCTRPQANCAFEPADGFIAAEALLEGPREARSAAVRSGGAPFTGIDIRVHEKALASPRSSHLVPLVLDAELRECALALARAGVDEGPLHLDALLRVLEARGVL
ncbi:MAG: hypothetical protein JNK04_21890, partial [Myxococcales bacterium]|nr:hypothetical protein [Myxococcales bacterium]